MDLKNFRIDIGKSDQGVWSDIGDGTKLKIARFGNSDYKIVFNRLYKAISRLPKTGVEAEKRARKILCETMAQTILLGWEGLELDGKEIKYSHGAALDLLIDPVYAPFYDFIMQFSQDEENFRQEEIKEAVGEQQAT